ncbi:hypothetical protein JW756_04465 [Candidatus Woesearchaeota archaeon]|nr:hypothetical protein [Candidatus Woesearchaeota archaeon]
MMQTQISESYKEVKNDVSSQTETPFRNALISYQATNLDLIMTQSELIQFKEHLKVHCKRRNDIAGILVTGSFVQCGPSQIIIPPVNFIGSAAKYYEICMRKKRKPAPHKNSDLDIWVCTRDYSKQSKLIKQEINAKTASLLEWYASEPEATADEFDYRTKLYFGPYYKNSDLYSLTWKSENPTPWLAEGFKEEFSEILQKCSPRIKEKLHLNVDGRSLDEFIELRAYPESTFNLKPHLTKCYYGISREPFPYFIRDLVTLERNCMVLYEQEGGKTIYPFDKEGLKLGEEVAQKIGWDRQKEEILYQKRFMVNIQ